MFENGCRPFHVAGAHQYIAKLHHQRQAGGAVLERLPKTIAGIVQPVQSDMAKTQSAPGIGVAGVSLQISAVGGRRFLVAPSAAQSLRLGCTAAGSFSHFLSPVQEMRPFEGAAMIFHMVQQCRHDAAVVKRARIGQQPRRRRFQREAGATFARAA